MSEKDKADVPWLLETGHKSKLVCNLSPEAKSNYTDIVLVTKQFPAGTTEANAPTATGAPQYKPD